MKKIFIALIAIYLSGCATFTPKFPDVADEELLKACPDLKLSPNTEKLSVVLGVVTDNYAEYHICRAKVNAWIDWYSKQKKIFDDTKKDK